MLNNVLNAIFPRRRPEPRSAGYKAGYASGLTAAQPHRQGFHAAGRHPSGPRCAGRLERRIQRRIAGSDPAPQPSHI